MAKVDRRIPLIVRKARLRDYHLNKEYEERNKKKYPECIGSFPECSNLKIGETCNDCSSCPFFCKESLEKLNGGIEMKNKANKRIEKSEIGKAKPKVDKEQEKKEKIRQMLENYDKLKPASKAWLKMWAKKGLVDMAEIEKIKAKA